MDTARGLSQARHEADTDPTDAGVGEATIEIGGDERRMHVRAYNHWVSLLKGRAYPSIEDLDPASIADFGPHSVLLDFSGGIEDPAIQYLGRALREECSLDQTTVRISQVPTRSLLSRLTDHYLQIIANRAPIGFEAEFVASRGNNTMYRGILMPFSSDEDSIDYIYGVINWKELVAPAEQALLDAELAEAVRAAPRNTETPAIWADGPSAGVNDPTEEEVVALDDAAPESLHDRLAIARETAAVARAADTRSRSALYRALGRAHDFALSASTDEAGLTELLDDAGIVRQSRAPMTPIVKLVFGADYDKTRLTEFAAVLTHAGRVGVLTGELGEFLDGVVGGIKGVVAAERALRRPAVAKTVPSSDRPTIATVTVATQAAVGEVVLLIARVNAAGTLDVFGTVEGDAKLTARVVASLG